VPSALFTSQVSMCQTQVKRLLLILFEAIQEYNKIGGLPMRKVISGASPGTMSLHMRDYYCLTMQCMALDKI